MNWETQKLEDLCNIKTGKPTGRAKEIPENVEPQEIKVLLPRAMQKGIVIDDLLAEEMVGVIKPEDLTQLDDVIIKLSTPFDSVRIDKKHTGILITSFGMILRKKEDTPLNMQYLSMYINSPQTNAKLAAVGTGTIMPMLKKGAVSNLDIPLPPIEEQELLAELFEKVRMRQAKYQNLIELDDELLNNQLTKMIWSE